MSIKFICICGKRLRARDEMASRRSVCPRCGAPVGIPSRQAPVRGAPAGTLSPAEKFHTRRVVPRTESILSEFFGVEPEAICEIGPVIGAHVGPGLLGVGGIPSSLAR